MHKLQFCTISRVLVSSNLVPEEVLRSLGPLGGQISPSPVHPGRMGRGGIPEGVGDRVGGVAGTRTLLSHTGSRVSHSLSECHVSSLTLRNSSKRYKFGKKKILKIQTGLTDRPIKNWNILISGVKKYLMDNGDPLGSGPNR